MSTNDNEQVPNAALHHYATGHAFVMTLTRNQIHGLDLIARSDDMLTRFSRFVSAMKELESRGLVQHRHGPNFAGERGAGGPITNYYRLTKAGWLMHDLLAEAGLVSAVTERKLRRMVAEAAA